MSIAVVPLVSPGISPAQIILVQGLDGTLYGPEGQMSAFVTALAEHHPDLNIFGLTYPSRLRDYAQGHGRSVSDISLGLIKHLTASPGPVILIGHCLGALVCTQALMGLSGQKPIQALLFDALLDHPGPSTGAWEQGLLAALDLPLPWMRKHGQAWRRFMSPAPAGLQVDAILSRSTSWVTPFHPTTGIPPDHQHQTDLSHQDLMIGTATKGHSVFALINSILGCHPRQSPGFPPNAPPPPTRPR